jgi:hypothetical protein
MGEFPDASSGGLSAPVLRSQLEAPTFGVNLWYLLAMDQVITAEGIVATSNTYTDVALRHVSAMNDQVNTGVITCSIRYTPLAFNQAQGYFLTLQNTGACVSLYRGLSGAISQLGSDATAAGANGSMYFMNVSATGSTIKSFEYNASGGTSSAYNSNGGTFPALPGPQISVTDTSIASGRCAQWWWLRLFRNAFEGGTNDNKYLFANPMHYRILPAQSPIPAPQAIVEVEFEDVPADAPGNALGAYRRPKVPEGHTWGAIDHRPGKNTGLVAITKPGPRITQHLDDIRAAGKKVYTAPFDHELIYSEATADRRDWLITKDELRHQLTGGQTLEPDSVVSFYEREMEAGRLRDVSPNVLKETLGQHLRLAKSLNRTSAYDRLGVVLSRA